MWRLRSGVCVRERVRVSRVDAPSVTVWRPSLSLCLREATSGGALCIYLRAKRVCEVALGRITVVTVVTVFVATVSES